MINIPISNTFKNNDLDTILSENDIESNEYILNAGTLLLKLKKNNKNNKDYDIFNLVSFYQNTIDELNNKLKLVENNNIIPNVKDYNIMEYLDKKHDDMYNKLTTNLNNYDNNINQNLNPMINKINDINQNFFKFFSKFDSGNVEKGNFGEKFIQTYLYDKFSNCSITDTHKNTSYGDMLFKFEKLNTMIESKNVMSLKREDINKFYKDIKIRTENSEINSALFVSLNDINISDSCRYFSFEIKNKIPVIFISNVFKNPELIRISIIILNYISKFISNFNNNISVHSIVNDLENSIQLINKQFEYIDTDKKLITKFQQNLVTKENDLDKLLKIIINTIQNNKIETSENIDFSLDTIVKILKNERLKDPNFKLNLNNIHSYNISKYVVKKYGGVKRINQIINDEINKDTYIIL
tara:strand:- start:1724 stop:2959 length:1236 start_codon:yes stop_codon:yes gene_type:complete